MKLITLYLLIGLLLEFIFDNLGRWSSPDYKSFGVVEKVIVIVMWPLTLILFIVFLVIELLKLRK
jgi:hypothetical protein